MKRNVSIYAGIWSVIFCMITGLVMQISPLIIIERALMSFAVSAMLGYAAGATIEKYSGLQQRSPLSPSDRAKGQEEKTR